MRRGGLTSEFIGRMSFDWRVFYLHIVSSKQMKTLYYEWMDLMEIWN